MLRKIAAGGMALSVSLAAIAQTSAVGPGDPGAEKSTDQNSGPALSGTLSTPRASGTYGGTVETGTTGNGGAEASGTDSAIPIPHNK